MGHNVNPERLASRPGAAPGRLDWFNGSGARGYSTAKAASINDDVEPVVLSIKADGQIFIQETPIELEAIAPRLGIKAHAYWETAPVQRWREMASVRMLYSNVLRWYKAPVKPHATKKDFFETLDVLLPGGSIHWSGEHARLFTPERSERLATEFANQNFASPPKIDPKGIETMDRLLAYLKKKNVEVAFVHPPSYTLAS